MNIWIMIWNQKHTTYLNFLFVILMVFTTFSLDAQKGIGKVKALKALTPKRVGSKLEKGASRALRKELTKKKSALRNEAKRRTNLKNRKDLPNSKVKVEEEYDPVMEDLIEDPEAKNNIENPNNKTRFVNLFGQWWMTPSKREIDINLKEQFRIDSIKALWKDTSNLRVPKMVGDSDEFITIFGWHRHFYGNRYKTYNYKLLTAIAYYSYDVDPFTGEPLDSTVINDFLGGDDPASGIVPTAHENDCKVLLSISSHSRDNNIIFLDPDNAEAQQNLIDNIIYLLDTSKADGIEINFENVPRLYRADYYKFVKRLSYTIRKTSDTLSVCMSVPVYDPENIFDLGRMEEDVDFFIIKAENYHENPDQPTELVKKPGAPLNYTPAAGEEDIRSTTDRYIASIGQANANRLILALPNYGLLWETTNDGFELLARPSYSTIRYDYLGSDMDSSKLTIDSNYFSFRYQQFDTIWENNTKTTVLEIIQRDLYFDDVATLKKKYNFILDRELGGVGILPLGDDIGYEQIWNTIESEFTTIQIPEDQFIDRVKEVSRKAISWSAVVLTVLLFWAIFASAGFCVALFKQNTRRVLFANSRFRMTYLGFFTILILLIGMFFGLFVGKTATLVLGVLLGAVFSYGIIVILNKQRSKAP